MPERPSDPDASVAADQPATSAAGGLRERPSKTRRKQESHDLQSLGELVEPALRQTLENKLSLEARHRIEQLLAGLTEPVAPPDRLRVFRALEVLEYLRTPEAVRALQELAKGAPAWPASEAKASLDRLNLSNPKR